MSSESPPEVIGKTEGISSVVTAMGELFQDPNSVHGDLELISRVWNGDHATMYERVLTDLAPLAETVQRKSVTPKPVYDRKERIIWMRDEFTSLHTESLKVDEDRVNGFIKANPGLLLLDNGSGHIFAHLGYAGIVQGKTIREPSRLALFRGKKIELTKNDRCQLVCSMGLVVKIIAEQQEQE